MLSRARESNPHAPGVFKGLVLAILPCTKQSLLISERLAVSTRDLDEDENILLPAYFNGCSRIGQIQKAYVSCLFPWVGGVCEMICIAICRVRRSTMT